MNESMLQSIKNSECLGCYEKIRSDKNSPFCSNRCSIHFDEHAPVHLIHEVYKTYQELKDTTNNQDDCGK